MGEFIKWYNIRDEISRKGLPERAKSISFWVITIIMWLFGGVMVFVYIKTGAVLNAFLAIQIGASTPLIITGITKEIPSISPGNVD